MSRCISVFCFILGDDEVGEGNDSSWSMDCSTILRVKSIFISSAILAAKSPFFYKVMMTLSQAGKERHVKASGSLMPSFFPMCVALLEWYA